jgi:hypothetical protein
MKRVDFCKRTGEYSIFLHGAILMLYHFQVDISEFDELRHDCIAVEDGRTADYAGKWME